MLEEIGGFVGAVLQDLLVVGAPLVGFFFAFFEDALDLLDLLVDLKNFFLNHIFILMEFRPVDKYQELQSKYPDFVVLHLHHVLLQLLPPRALVVELALVVFWHPVPIAEYISTFALHTQQAQLLVAPKASIPILLDSGCWFLRSAVLARSF